MDKEKEHKSAVLTQLKNFDLYANTLSDFEANFKPISRSIVSFAQNLSSNKDIRDVFVQLVEKPYEAFKTVNATSTHVDLFLKAYGDVIKDNIVLVDNDVKIIITKFMRTFKPVLLAIYE